ncbi:MAG: hypothetical protein H7Z12_00360 [Rhodospirillaceae bacterium]|nr:hypothetical protein [Rhodospirillales bacterium]
MRGSSLPFWQSFNLDPDYYYLLNGLRIIEGLAPTDISHPGTPVQVLIAVVMKALHPLDSSAAIVDAVLAAPEQTLLAVTSVIYVLVGAALWWLGRVTFATTGLLLPALLAQSAPFLSRIIPKFGLHPKPEPFLIIAVALLIAALLPLVRARTPTDRHAALAGIAMALGVACKIHFAVLGVIPLLLLDRRRFLIYVGVGAAALVVFVAPAIPSWAIWTKWITGMMFHSGAYGEGAATIIDTGRYPRAVLKLFSSKLIFSAVILASLVQLAAYVRMRRRGLVAQDKFARLLVGILAAQFLIVLSVAKQPAAHYLVPALLLTGPAMAALWSLSRAAMPARTHCRLWLGVAVVLTVAQAPQMWRQNAELKAWTAEQMAVDLGARFPGCAKVYFDAASGQSYAFQRGDMNAQARYSAKLAALFPADEYTWFTNDHTYWKRGLMQWNQPVALADILARHGCAVFRGNQPWTLPARAAEQIPGFQLDDRCETGEETLFTKGVTCDGTKVNP